MLRLSLARRCGVAPLRAFRAVKYTRFYHDMPNTEYYRHISPPAQQKAAMKEVDAGFNVEKALERIFDSSVTSPSGSEIFTQPSPKAEDQIIIALSSGVDSSVTAALLNKRYKNTKAIYMCNWEAGSRCTEAEWYDVQSVCGKLEIPCERVNFEKEYWINVFEPMLDAYSKGLTPNPDVNCNRHIKFGALIAHLKQKLGEEGWWLATGHYSRILQSSQSGKNFLMRGVHSNKDQSYYLANIERSVLARTLLPLGHLTKPEVRKLALDLDLPTAMKPDSQGLCFVSQNESYRNFREFLAEYISPKPGNIVTEDGTVLGKHDGLWHSTVGQKSGICAPQGDPKLKGTWFTSGKDQQTNNIIVVKGGSHPSLFKNKVRTINWTWLIEDPENHLKTIEGDITFQFRSLQKATEVKELTRSDNGEFLIHLKEPCRAIAPGQTAVLYNGDIILGSGLIVGTE